MTKSCAGLVEGDVIVFSLSAAEEYEKEDSVFLPMPK